MNDVIYRQAALDALGERPMAWTDDDYVLGARNQYDMDRLAIETVPSAQPEDRCGECDAWNQYKNYPQPRWIPVVEHLPKKDGDYLVTTYSGQIARYIFIGGSSEEYWRRCATAWMPLPKPWEGGLNE